MVKSQINKKDSAICSRPILPPPINGICHTCLKNTIINKLICLHTICSDCLETMTLYFDQPYCFLCKSFTTVCSTNMGVATQLL